MVHIENIGHFYRDFLERLHKRVMHVRPNIKNNWVLHYDNAPCHSAISVNPFFWPVRTFVWLLSPFNCLTWVLHFFLSPRLKTHLKGRRFGTLENIQSAVTDQLKAIPVSEFQHCYEEWKNHPQCCVASPLKGAMFNCNITEIKQVKKSVSLLYLHTS